MKILGIETSCDETAIAIIEAEGGIESPNFKLLGSAVHSQIEMHREYGGVYPMLAKREHIKNLPLVLEKVFKEAGLGVNEIDKIAVTVGPGLEPALWTGIKFAEELSQKYNIPLIPTNHMEGHIASILLTKDENQRVTLVFPAIALLISGGHTELILMNSWTDKKIIGETMDDAVGEAFDKVARMLGLPYPGGPEISRLATQARELGIMNYELKLPRPMINSGDYNFSFSGLKTAVLYYIRKIQPHPALPQGEGTSPFPLGEGMGMGLDLKKKIAKEFEEAVAEVLISKSRRAIEEFNPQTFIIGGGVIANSYIRSEFEKMISDFPGIKLLVPDKPLTTDNAVMIAMAGYFAHLTHQKLELKAQGNLKII